MVLSCAVIFQAYMRCVTLACGNMQQKFPYGKSCPLGHHQHFALHIPFPEWTPVALSFVNTVIVQLIQDDSFHNRNILILIIDTITIATNDRVDDLNGCIGYPFTTILSGK
jgi:hypothetical protein